MKPHHWNRVAEEQMNPLVARKVIHTSSMTLAKLRLKKSAVVPEHSHVNEQITIMEQGKLRFVIDGVEKVIVAGDILEIPPHAKHMVEALEDSLALDLFSPAREDWIRGDDAY